MAAMTDASPGQFVLPVVMRVADRHRRKARYVLDTLMMASGIGIRFRDSAPTSGPWMLYSTHCTEDEASERCLLLPYHDAAWNFFDGASDVEQASRSNGVEVVLPGLPPAIARTTDIGFDLLANAFYFLSSWSERRGHAASAERKLHSHSVFVRLGIDQDIVDRYLRLLQQRLAAFCARVAGLPLKFAPPWPGGARHALVLSHDVDFLPAGARDIAVQGARTLLRHLLHHRDPLDALRAGLGWSRSVVRGRDPYGCLSTILDGETRRGVRSSFQIAVARRHPHDVNYSIDDASVRVRLRAIVDAGFDLCLHGSYRSTEVPGWYESEVEILSRGLARPNGNRQHYLSFDYDALFRAQERAGIRYDMSIGYPDCIGSRCGFSFPYFPYSLDEDRPYDVVEIGLSIMDVTLRGYMRLKGENAWAAIQREIDVLASSGGCSSVVWHPIVFAGARDPGYDRLYWRLVDRVIAGGGLATDGRTIDLHWRRYAAQFSSFSGAPT